MVSPGRRKKCLAMLLLSFAVVASLLATGANGESATTKSSCFAAASAVPKPLKLTRIVRSKPDPADQVVFNASVRTKIPAVPASCMTQFKMTLQVELVVRDVRHLHRGYAPILMDSQRLIDVPELDPDDPYTRQEEPSGKLANEVVPGATYNVPFNGNLVDANEVGCLRSVRLSLYSTIAPVAGGTASQRARNPRGLQRLTCGGRLQR
jgi:hypothetical protein